MNLRKHATPQHPGIQLAPLVDVLLLLLIFFLMTWNAARNENELDVKVPKASSAKEKAAPIGDGRQAKMPSSMATADSSERQARTRRIRVWAARRDAPCIAEIQGFFADRAGGRLRFREGHYEMRLYRSPTPAAAGCGVPGCAMSGT